MFRQMRYLPVSLFILLCACGSSTENPKDKDAASPGVAAEGNYLVMKINGREWKADQGIFAAFHPPGYNKAIVIAGTKGPKDKNEQAFTINLYNTEGPAIFTIKEGNPDFSVAQMANISPENFMYGSVMGLR